MVEMTNRRTDWLPVNKKMVLKFKSLTNCPKLTTDTRILLQLSDSAVPRQAQTINYYFLSEKFKIFFFFFENSYFQDT